MIIVATGSRDITDRHKFVVVEALDHLVNSIPTYERCLLTVGDARGVDAVVRDWAEYQGFSEGNKLRELQVFVADWTTWGAAAGPRRNQAMLDHVLTARHPNELVVCLGFPRGASRGTRGCMKAAQNLDIPVLCHEFLG